MKKLFCLPVLLPVFLCVNSIHAQWTDISIPYTYALTGGSFLNDNNGYVIAYGYPMVFKTTNGGTAWDSLIINPGIGAIDIDFISIDTGFVLVYSGAIHMLKTTYDGGNSWMSDTLPAGGNYQMIRFTSASIGYANSYGFVYKTTNGGQNWTALPVGESFATDKEYTGSDTIIFTGGGGTFLYQGSVISSVNSGASFEEYDCATMYSTFTGTHFLNGQTGYATFTFNWPALNYLITTTNGGNSWVTILTDSNFIFTDVFMTNSTQGYITNQTITTGTILKVNGGSTTLDYTSNFPLKRFYKGGNTLFAVGEAGKVVKRGLPLGIENEMQTLSGIYPNPTTDIINIPLESISDITVIDMNGKVVLLKTVLPGELISLGQLANGMYCIRVKNEKGVFSGRVVVNK